MLSFVILREAKNLEFFVGMNSAMRSRAILPREDVTILIIDPDC